MGLPSLQSPGFCWYCDVDLGSVLIKSLSNSTLLSPAAQNGCGSVLAKSKQQDLSDVWHFMMSVMGDSVDVQLVFSGYLRAKNCHSACQIEDKHTVFRASKHIVCNYNSAGFMIAVGVMFVYNGCIFCSCVHTQTHTTPYFDTLLAKQKPHT